MSLDGNVLGGIGDYLKNFLQSQRDRLTSPATANPYNYSQLSRFYNAARQNFNPTNPQHHHAMQTMLQSGPDIDPVSDSKMISDMVKSSISKTASMLKLRAARNLSLPEKG